MEKRSIKFLGVIAGIRGHEGQGGHGGPKNKSFNMKNFQKYGSRVTQVKTEESSTSSIL